MKRTLLLITLIITALLAGAWGLLICAHKSIRGQAILAFLAPRLLSPERLLKNLDSNDPALVANTLFVFQWINDPTALDKASELLHSPVLNVWLTAAGYRAHFEKQDAVPYLIKGLDFPGTHTYIQQDLIALTGQDFGTDFMKWRNWWSENNPISRFNFDTGMGLHDENVHVTPYRPPMSSEWTNIMTYSNSAIQYQQME